MKGTPHVEVKAEESARALFVLAKETDPEEGTVDLTSALGALVASGLRQSRSNPEDGVPFGSLTIDDGLSVTVDGRGLVGEELATAIHSGFLNAIYAAIDAELRETGVPEEEAAE